jgi:LAO/AO transport system kinase
MTRAPKKAPRKKPKAAKSPAMALVPGVLKRQTRAIARMISVAEAARPEDRAALAEVYRHAGRAHVVGLTGVPGSGKSTLATRLIKAARASGRTVGVVAIDPSSPFSGGAILGDRVRMSELAGDDGVFIRSMATRGALGGLARASLEAIDVLDAAGFDIVLVETVGVGQDEVDVVQVAHTVVVVSAPGLGDEIQAIKAGILEIADIHVVSKCDRADANATITDLKGMLALGVRTAGLGDKAWPVPVVPTSAEKNHGIDELLATIDRHGRHLKDSGVLEIRRRQIMEMRVLKTAEDIVRKRFRARRDGLQGLMKRVIDRKMDPHQAAKALLKAINGD